MKKLIVLSSLLLFGLRFTTKKVIETVIKHPKVITTFVTSVFIQSNLKSQTADTTWMDQRYKSINYVPVLYPMTIDHYPHIRVDDVVNYEAPVYEWNNIQTKPNFCSVASSCSYFDLSWAPTIPTSGAGIWNNNNQWNVDSTKYLRRVDASTLIAGAGFITSESDPNVPSYAKSLSAFSVIKSSTDALYLTSEVDGSITNEIELPSQTGNSGRFLTTNGSSPSWASALTSEIDGSTTNEIQAISISGNTISLSVGGGTVLIPTQTVSATSNTRTIAFNTAYQPSTTRDIDVRTNTQISCNLSLSGGQSGSVELQISANGTSGWIVKRTLVNSNTGTLTIGLNTTQVNGSELSCIVPSGWYYRLVNSGTGTFTILNVADEYSR